MAGWAKQCLRFGARCAAFLMLGITLWGSATFSVKVQTVLATDGDYAKVFARENIHEIARINQQGRRDGLFLGTPYRTSATTMSTDIMASGYNGQLVTVTAKAQTVDGTWLQVQLNNSSYWLDARGVQLIHLSTITNQMVRNEFAQITQSKRNDGLFKDGPYNTSTTSLSANDMAKNYQGQGVQVVATAKAGGIQWAQIKLPSGQLYWIDARGLRVITLHSLTNSKTVDQPARINQGARNDGLFVSGPYMSSVDSLSTDIMAKSHNGEGVTVIQEAQVEGLSWAKIKMTNGNQYWIDARGIKPITLGTISNQVRLSNQAGVIVQQGRNDGLFQDGPFWTSLTTLGPSAMAKAYSGQAVTVLEAATSGNTEWLQVQMSNGQKFWIDAHGVRRVTLNPITAQESANQDAMLIDARATDGLFTAGPYQSQLNALSADGYAKTYLGQGGHIDSFAMASGVRWAHMTFADHKSYWLDARLIKAVTLKPIQTQQAVDRNAIVNETGRNDGLFLNGPYLSSYTTLQSAGSLRQMDHQVVHVLQVATAGGISWSQIEATNAKRYWVDSRALNDTIYDMVLTNRSVSKSAQINQSGRRDGLFQSGPYHTSPATASTTLFASRYNGQYVSLIAEAKTRIGNWVKIKLSNGKTYWLDANGVRVLNTPIAKVLNVPNYNQFKEGAPVGCEGVSLYQALRAKGDAAGYSLRAFLNTIPKASSPFNGFVGSPFVANSYTYTAIFAAPLAKWGARFGTVANVSGSSVNQLMQMVLGGDPVVAYVTEHFAPVRWGNWSFGRVPNNNHAVTIAGADLANQQLYLSDPIDGKYWISVNKFAAVYNIRKMAVVVR